MAQSSVLREIRSLREDIGQMKGHLVSMRYEDFRQAFVDELALAAGQEGVRSLDDLSGIQGATDCKARSACTSKIRESVVRLADDLRQDDTDAARRRLSELEGVLCGDASPCQDSACNAAAIQTLNRVRTVLDVYERVRTRLHEDDGGGASRERPTESAEEIERALAPLANARRLEALRWLAAEDLSLSDLARKLGIPTGHLQFHVRVLRDAGLISTVNGRRLYSVTMKGRAALGLAESMADSLAKAPA